jgi:hypothetical protein
MSTERMTNQQPEFKPGDRVRVKGKKAVAVIERLSPTTEDRVILKTPLVGWCCWDIERLEHADE